MGRLTRIDGPSFGYLGAGDRQLIRDALVLQCEAFLTMEGKLPKNAAHVQRELGIQILTPSQYWESLRPWARLYV